MLKYHLAHLGYILVKEWLDTRNFGCFGALLGLEWFTSKGLHVFVTDVAFGI